MKAILDIGFTAANLTSMLRKAASETVKQFLQAHGKLNALTEIFERDKISTMLNASGIHVYNNLNLLHMNIEGLRKLEKDKVIEKLKLSGTSLGIKLRELLSDAGLPMISEENLLDQNRSEINVDQVVYKECARKTISESQYDRLSKAAKESLLDLKSRCNETLHANIDHIIVSLSNLSLV